MQLKTRTAQHNTLLAEGVSTRTQPTTGRKSVAMIANRLSPARTHSLMWLSMLSRFQTHQPSVCLHKDGFRMLLTVASA